MEALAREIINQVHIDIDIAMNELRYETNPQKIEEINLRLKHHVNVLRMVISDVTDPDLRQRIFNRYTQN